MILLISGLYLADIVKGLNFVLGIVLFILGLLALIFIILLLIGLEDDNLEYTNKILNLNHVVAIRKNIAKPVIERETENLNYLVKDLEYGLKSYKRIAIITKTDSETNKLYNYLKDKFNISNMLDSSLIKNPNLVIIPTYLAKGLEFDFVIIYTDLVNKYTILEKYLFYVAVTRCQHELIVYNQL